MQSSTCKKPGISAIRSACMNENGAVLIVSLVFMVLLAMLGITAVVMTTTDMKIGANYKDKEQAFCDAEAGVKYGLGKMEAELKASSSTFSLPTIVGNSFDLDADATFTTPTGFKFSYQAPGLTMLATNLYTFTTDGTGTNNSTATITVTLKRGSVITMAAFGDEKMGMKNSAQVYSYDSRTSAPATGLGDSTGQGDIGSNQEVETKSSSVIDGDGVFGEFADGSATTNDIHSTADFEGDAPTNVGRIDPDPLGINSGGEFDPTSWSNPASNDNNLATGPSFSGGGAIVGDFIGLGSSYTDSTMTLPGKVGGANYYITAIDLKNSTTLNIDTTLGPVRLFLDNPGASPTTFKLTNSAAINVTPAANADQFGFFTNFTGSLDVKNGGDFNGLFYAPKADVIIHNTGNLNGAAWGKTVDIRNDGIVNYNTALADRYTSNELTMTSWNDVRN
jgi:hypothetical protein